MKYFVSKITKEHIPVSRALPWVREGDDWRIVEADSEGWIPWSGGECPLPTSKLAEVRLQDGQEGRFESIDLLTHRSWQKWNCGGDIIAYRPILETAETVEPAWDGYTEDGQIDISVFDRLKSAVEAANTIPVLIAHINLLLPDGYCVTRCGSQPAKETYNANN